MLRWKCCSASAVNESVGGGSATTTVALLLNSSPPAPVQARVKVVVAARTPVDWLPARGLGAAPAARRRAAACVGRRPGERGGLAARDIESGSQVSVTVGAAAPPSGCTSMALTQASPLMRLNCRFRVESVVTVKVPIRHRRGSNRYTREDHLPSAVTENVRTELQGTQDSRKRNVTCTWRGVVGMA